MCNLASKIDTSSWPGPGLNLLKQSCLPKISKTFLIRVENVGVSAAQVDEVNTVERRPSIFHGRKKMFCINSVESHTT